MHEHMASLEKDVNKLINKKIQNRVENTDRLCSQEAATIKKLKKEAKNLLKLGMTYKILSLQMINDTLYSVDPKSSNHHHYVEEVEQKHSSTNQERSVATMSSDQEAFGDSANNFFFFF